MYCKEYRTDEQGIRDEEGNSTSPKGAKYPAMGAAHGNPGMKSKVESITG